MANSVNSPTLDWLSADAIEQRVDVQPKVRALTAAIAAGDTEAFTRFYHEWFDSMLAEARRATRRDESFCLDIVQDALMRVIRAIKPMNSTDDVRRWLRVVVQTCAYDLLRRESRRRRLELEAAQGRSVAPAAAEDPRPRLEWIERQLRSLDDRQVQLLLMRHRFGWTLRQIGEALGRKPGAIDSRLKRLLASLRRRALRGAP